MIRLFLSSSGYPTIDDILDQNKLPSGPLPVWILRSKEVEPIQVLEHLKGEGFIEEGERCTVVNTGVDKNGQNGAFAEWCQRNGWKFCPTWRSLIGSEDQVKNLILGLISLATKCFFSLHFNIFSPF